MNKADNPTGGRAMRYGKPGDYKSPQDEIDNLRVDIDGLEQDKKRLSDLVREVISDHADPESPWYNECEACNNEVCAWCSEAKQILGAEQ